ncbi:alpha/beta hydrolase [Actinomadura violacea]|uniref:Alpha/beta fold hydrolase n=1 Tax=Actinomadura violacea TaxID=2819934 RepID=A0ABS3RN36_9ACTN|nr:alpha/beta hydrolase [Actinomadura violacea]MBO2458167.1 alpha/beta fold hydrolase [Actinomadura violacea]
MPTSVQREKVRFDSAGTECVAWHYPSVNGACVVMAGGFAVTKEPGTDLFARRFHEAGFGVLAFDYRHIGESGGQPRQIARVREYLQDWQNAVAFAATLPGVNPDRIAAWGFSLSGGHLFRVAARTPQLAAVVAQTPAVGGWTASRAATRHQKTLPLLRFFARGIADAAGWLLGRPPRMVPLAAPPGELAMLSTPDSLDGPRALDPDGRHTTWRQEIAARSALRFALYQPGRQASRIRCPVQVMVCEHDMTAHPPSAIRVAHRTPRAELVQIPGTHYAPFLNEHDRAVREQMSFLHRHLAASTRTNQSASTPS